MTHQQQLTLSACSLQEDASTLCGLGKCRSRAKGSDTTAIVTGFVAVSQQNIAQPVSCPSVYL